LLDRRVSFLVFGPLIAAVLLTAFYTFRMVYLTFHGDFQGGGAQEAADAQRAGVPVPDNVSVHVHLGESPWVMVLPMLLLAFAALVSGYLVNPQGVESFLSIPKHWITEYFAQALTYRHLELPPFDITMAVVSNVVAFIGIALASLLYLRRKQGSPLEMKDPQEKIRPVHALLTQKYYLDALYENLMVRRWFYGYLAAFSDWIDRSLVDGLVDLMGGATRNSGKVLALLQTGQVQFYGSVVVFGVIAILVGFILLGSGA
jgi:NADH-quinone oxidoreductase subunit L